MANKYYAVKKGRKTGIFTTWSEAQPHVSGYSGAEYKSFTSKSEAESFISVNQVTPPKDDHRSLVAYVDGSFDKTAKRYSYGVVLIQNDQVIEEIKNSDNNPVYAESYQIAGECFGSLNAIKWAIAHQYKHISIYYDYLGIEMWARGKWKANKKVSQDYVTYFKKYAQEIEVQFVKVKAHTGVQYNERADQLAKDALR